MKKPSHRKRFLAAEIDIAVEIVFAPAPAAQASPARHQPAEIVEKARPALAAGERAVERGHGAGEAGIVVLDEGAQHAGEHQRRALGAQHAPGTRRVDAGGRQHPLLGPHREAVERHREPGIAPHRAQQRADRRLVRRERLEPAHQHVEQPLARRLLGHVGVAAREHLAVDLLDMGGVDRKQRAEFAAQRGERDPGAGGDVGKADPLDRMLRQQGQEGGDDLVAIRRRLRS